MSSAHFLRSSACLPGAALASRRRARGGAPAGAARGAQVRVADADAEWTVSRRFRNFEALHRALRGVPAYRLRLPAKRIFPHNQSGEFVEERRRQLDAYLGAVLADAQLACARPARARRARRDPALMRGGGALPVQAGAHVPAYRASRPGRRRPAGGLRCMSEATALSCGRRRAQARRRCGSS